MILRLLGIGLLVAISVPLIIAFPPLALVAVGGGVLWLNGRRGSGASRRRRTSPSRSGSGPRRQRGRPAPRQRARTTNSRASSWFGRAARWMVVVIGAIWLVGTLANQAPGALANQVPESLIVIILLAAGGLFLLISTRVLRGPGQRREPTFVTESGYAGSGTTVQAGTDFEWQVVDLLSELDFRRVEHVGGPGDRGVDIIAEDKQGRTFLVQCKRFAPSKKVGSVDIQKLIGAVVHQGADGGIFVTTASFTGAAIDLANSGRVPIELMDGRDVARLSRAVA